MLKKFTNKKGFTLMEMLIVVAIIAVLVAIAIPTFKGQLDKSRQATDLANIRVAYADANLDALNSADGTGTAVSAKMTHSGKFDKVENPTIGGVDIKEKQVTKGKTVTVSIDAAGEVTITPAT